MRYVLALSLLAGAAAYALLMPQDSQIAGLDPGQIASVVGSVLLLILIAGSLGAEWRGRVGAAIAGALAWGAIFAAVMVGYVYREEVGAVTVRMMDEIVPGRTVQSSPGEAVAIRRSDGHFGFDTRVNGAALRMMFDTGASSIVLRAEDVSKVGLNADKLDYRVPVSTANGRALAAPVTLEAVTVGNITVKNVRALVARPGVLQENLLGQSYLSRLSGYSVERNRLVLRQ
ncbi:MAG: TIGR02281 family clan AA aspartic protease [Beijerinckiaceae bacterium]|nr:TIGR02281 family clan AA aspartic protease [Beijerinckiaceae bacterium]